MGIVAWDENRRRGFAKREAAIAGIQQKLRAEQDARYVKDLSGQSADQVAPSVAAILNYRPGDDEPVKQAMYDQVASKFNSWRPMGLDPETVRGDDPLLVQAMGGLGDQEKREIYDVMAQIQTPNVGVRLKGLEASANRLLGREDWQGRTARAGLYSGIAAGGAMGLTAAGQGLMALADYIQQGMSSQAEREQPLV